MDPGPTIFRPIAFVLAAILLAGAILSCGSESDPDPTPDVPATIDAAVKAVTPTQIHHLMGGKDLVGASGKAGYDGYGTNTTITNEVQSLCNRESCHSSMGRSIARGA